ncbi:class I SAM-dependent methyltransferase [Paludibacter sp. 221]|uniref:class I SAM-dependent methyltransferase n=1 Tax=Paludibacter sp. 221 TaxID=2302939 RepID=UPI0013D07942|nr:class I SAM-dependent methyltransferase [Paludibacter sp. 221]NDV47618.1 class I SAM-dependent methyltransferase [Paludibacter sp. 221]
MNLPEVLLSEFLYDMDSLGPECLSLTKTIIKELSYLPQIERIADISCGYGNLSIALYELTNADIIAIDHRSELIEIFQNELKFNKLNNHIIAKYSKLDKLPFNEEELDILWSSDLPSEFTFKRVLSNWSQFIKRNGYIVICAYCWNSPYKPKEVSDFFLSCGIEIDHISNRIEEMENKGFAPVSHFIVPDTSWWIFFYSIDVQKENLSKKYANNKDVQSFLRSINLAVNLFEKYRDYYSYAYFVGRKLPANKI